MDGFGDGAPLCVAPYPVAWRIEPSYDQGFEYVRSGQISPNAPEHPLTKRLAFSGGSRKRLGTCRGAAKIMAERLCPTDTKELRLNSVTIQVQVYLDRWTSNCRIWKLVPMERKVKSKGKSPMSPFSTVSLDAPPSYDGVTGEPGGSGVGTVVTEVTTVTTRTRYEP